MLAVTFHHYVMHLASAFLCLTNPVQIIEKTDDVQFPCQRCLQMHSVILQSCGTIEHRKIIYIFSKLEMILRL